jgi:D-alanyl-D-alanine dipeptidase
VFVLLDSSTDFFFEPVYYNNYHLQQPQLTSNFYVRLEVLEKLKMAQDFLPSFLTFKLFDAWRPFVVQELLYQHYIENAGGDPGYVYAPQRDRLNPPPHCSGGALDLTICDRQGHNYPMGTEHDEMVELARSDYFDQIDLNHLPADLKFTKSDVSRIQQNRQLLTRAMEAAGFFSYPQEWWHFDYGDILWAEANHCDQLYTGVWTEAELQEQLTTNLQTI